MNRSSDERRSIATAFPPWRPLLTGAEAEAAREVVFGIASALEETAHELTEPSLCDGQSGVALFFSLFYKLSGEARHAAMAERMVDAAMESLPEHSNELGLFSGVSGVAWAVRHSLSTIGSVPPGDLTEEIDATLLEVLEEAPWRWDYELTSGLVGFGCYALDHPDPDFSVAALNLVLARLEELAAPQPTGIAWLTPPELMSETKAAIYPQGGFDLGLAHGSAGVVALLARLVRLPSRDSADRARRLLAGALAWLLAQRRHAPDGSRYVTPGSAFAPLLPVGAPSGEGGSTRSAWCYGDPGVATALLAAAQVTVDRDLRHAALEIALRDCSRPRAETGVRDAGLCHGASGMGHLYHRLSQATGRREFAAAARRWFALTLEMRTPGAGLGGFQAWWDRSSGLRPVAGVLTGAAGVGLALLAAITAEPPAWDEAFLLSTPA